MGCNFILTLVHKLSCKEPIDMSTPIEDLNAAADNLTAKTNDLVTSSQNLDAATTNLLSRIAALPPASGPDLGPATAAVNAAANLVVSTSQAVDANVVKLNAALPPA